MQRKDGARPLSDRVRLQHMLDAAREALSFAKGRSRSDLDTSPMLRRALKDCIQEIGEAAAKVTDATRARASSLPWNQIVGMRHRIVHVYYDIDPNALWEVVEQDLPVLTEAINAVLQAWPADESNPA